MTLIAELNRTRRLGVEHELTMPRMGTASGTDVQNTLAEILTAIAHTGCSLPFVILFESKMSI